MNGDLLNGMVSAKEGRVARLAAPGVPAADAVRELYLVALSRPPRSPELTTALRLMHQAPKRKEAVEDLLWTLLNSREFMFNH